MTLSWVLARVDFERAWQCASPGEPPVEAEGQAGPDMNPVSTVL